MADEEEQAREEAAGWLILLDDDPSDPARQDEFKTWVQKPLNRMAWKSISRTGALLASSERHHQTANAAAIGSRGWSEPAWWHRAVQRRSMLVIIGTLCAVIALAPGLAIRWQADHVTGTAQLRSVRLDDGSTVQLGPDSAIRLDFSPEERRVTLLSGEALFDVTLNRVRPFRVATRDTITTVIGTRFDVTILDAGTSVAVARGHVQVEASPTAASYDLYEGDWVRVGKDGSVERASDLPDYAIAGPGPRLAVRNRAVAEVVERLRPWFAGRIVIADDVVGRQPVTGVFDAADPVRALEAIVGPQGGRVLRFTPWLLIVAKG